MSNMSYCRHENTASDLLAVIDNWGEWAEAAPQPGSESAARRHIIELALALTRALEAEGLVDALGELAEGAEFAEVYPEVWR
ncbi:hypothetical protein QN355_06370 [Cryobacterium sp. 10S3]|uniref:hypothetical protein n=1 Tax=Cryobacterium sp. 10S3 TaxID=3048582 RepID=UPI002AC8AE87|nr:hypothetical protein [Cryobacterium sp. 10S3]MEB0286173.1 hypothetical protein [Cryobacterium sp. 10S3]WPX12231.1 hypothetical protein RHM57_11110 [Cryobacterium sp. 10S3]